MYARHGSKCCMFTEPLQSVQQTTSFAHFTDGAPAAQRLGGLRLTDIRCHSWDVHPSTQPQGAVRWAPSRNSTGEAWVRGRGSRPAPWAGDRESCPSQQERLLLALSPRGQALQGKQKSVVNTVPNPKWLLPNCNPIKVRLVYLSSLGLFITVQMAATFGRLSSSLPAARHAKLSSTESGPAPVRGRARRPPARRVLCLPLLCSHSPLCVQSWWLTEQVARSLLCRASSRAGHAWCQAPNYPCGGCSWEGTDSIEETLWEVEGAAGGCQWTWHPMLSARRLRTRDPMGPRC